MKTIIIDDERLARKELNKLLEGFNEIEVVDMCSNVDEALISIEKNNPDLLFLDINMPEKSGFDLLEELETAPKVIFVTAYDEYAIKAFEVNALDYLLKPVELDRLESAIEKLGESSEPPEDIQINAPEQNGKLLRITDQIFLKDGEKCWFVKLADVRLFESHGNYVRVFFDDCKPLILKSLNKLNDRLDPDYFFRANRKYIVNLNRIEKIENWFNGGLQLTLDDGRKIEVSRRQASKFKEVKSL